MYQERLGSFCEAVPVEVPALGLLRRHRTCRSDSVARKEEWFGSWQGKRLVTTQEEARLHVSVTTGWVLLQALGIRCFYVVPRQPRMDRLPSSSVHTGHPRRYVSFVLPWLSKIRSQCTTELQTVEGQKDPQHGVTRNYGGPACES